MPGRRRVVLIEQPPDIWFEDGLVYVDFGIQGGTLLAYRPSALLASHARCDAAIAEWRRSGEQVVHLSDDERYLRRIPPG